MVALALLAGCAPGAGPERPGAGARGPGASGSSAPATVAPRWEEVARFSGTGGQRTPTFSIAPHAIQWRVTASCTRGRVRVALAGEAAALAEPDCPGRAFGFSVSEGTAALEIASTGDWEAVVDQQVDRPVAEPELAGMSGANRLASGTFYGIDQTGTGKVALYRLPDGRRALRFDPFVVTANTDLFVWVSEAEAPASSAEALASRHVQIGRLTATAGGQNYLLPERLDLDRVQSVVVWCEPVRTAYTAASLRR